MTNTIQVLTGTWYSGDGYLDELAERQCTIEIINGKAYDAILGEDFGPIKIGDDGHLRLWAYASFWPDAGELARVGLAPSVVAPGQMKD
jgi:hypothetical protein